MNSAFYFVFKQQKRTKGEGERWGEKSSYTIWSNSSRYVPNEVSSREYTGLFLISFPCEFISPEMIECIPSLFICFPFFLIHRRGIFISGQIMSIHSVLCARFIHKTPRLLHSSLALCNSIFIRLRFYYTSNRRC